MPEVNTMKSKMEWKVAGNVAKLEDCETLAAKTLEKFQKIDILVNNAGITKDGLMMRMSEQQWDAVINVNLKLKSKLQTS